MLPEDALRRNQSIEKSHKALIFACATYAAYVGGSAAAVALMGVVFGRHIVRLKSFNQVFANMMKADLIVTGMYLPHSRLHGTAARRNKGDNMALWDVDLGHAASTL